ncbi:hypothetical protein A11A3_00880 [Alcanivorax hongdengensis A-11-3]|uniref:Nucleoprotein/polynucleotide-associated enzyme n=1 Tax=Alcanivorax hongdengensis A-11-3 TaxID=1177179 RepID=L0WH15_9GAMM|nr:DUF2058 domain-containing protein [Alcanivorax hongdengensis]EKF76004.1 hypothetical protein A11A3_00880 [Alcanivorax hongdengensis A-11-3]
MANSLQQQLMKSGLADAKKARRAKQQKREDANKAKRGEIELDDPAERARRQRAEQAEKDRQREEQRKAEREQKEIAAQIRQMTEQSRLDRQAGDVPFQFVQDKKIKKAYVTAKQQNQLERGQIAIVALDDSYELVPTVVAEKIRQRDEQAVLFLAERNSNDVDEDDPYKDFPIPDDLMW